MKIGILGAGFTGYAAAYKLVKSGFDVTVIESGSSSGGLAKGIELNGWTWPIENHYHHLFTNDKDILSLAQEVGQEIIVSRPKTSVMVGSDIYQLDNPLSLLKFPHLSYMNRFRTGLSLFLLKSINHWKILEKISARDYITKTMGENSWGLLWKPLFDGKFGKHSDKISAAWFWARIKKRTPSLAYPVGGFGSFLNNLENQIKSKGCTVLYNKTVNKIQRYGQNVIVTTDTGKYIFDGVISTLPLNVFLSVAELPKTYINKYQKVQTIGAVTLILILRRQFLEDGTYWLNVNNRNYPFLAVVEHTNFIDRKYYANKFVVYVGNYLSAESELYNANKNSLFNTYCRYLTKINKSFNRRDVEEIIYTKSPFAQPLYDLNYSKRIPAIETPIDNLFLACMQQVYPWDRGTNYAVRLGNRVANNIINKYR